VYLTISQFLGTWAAVDIDTTLLVKIDFWEKSTTGDSYLLGFGVCLAVSEFGETWRAGVLANDSAVLFKVDSERRRVSGILFDAS
jgi:hypothetical protein